MTDRLSDRPIVVIEDSDEDFEVTVWALRQAGVANPVHRCENAAAICDMMAMRGGGFGGRTELYPALVLLDLNLPGADWQDTLSALRDDPWWHPVPVVVLSTSGQAATVSACYGLGASGYVQKPLNLDGLAAAISRLVAYWLETVTLPALPAPNMQGQGSRNR